jgi:predicted SprT family Zn-dependent metalloprotease
MSRDASLPVPMDSRMVKRWFLAWAELWHVPKLASALRVELSPRLSRSLGRCYPAAGRVRVSPQLFDEPRETVREVLCHEAAHVATHLLHGPSVRPHGPEWASLMTMAGYEPKVAMDVASSPCLSRELGRPRVLYRHLCPVCGATRVARRPVRAWRCRACRDAGLDGLLVVSTVAVTAKGWT